MNQRGIANTAALLAAAVLCGCLAPTRNTLPVTQIQTAGNYDRIASCFARRSTDREIADRELARPVLERFSNPDEIRVSQQIGVNLMWELDFRPLDEDRTGIETRIWKPPIGGVERQAGVIDDLRACGASEAADEIGPSSRR